MLNKKFSPERQSAFEARFEAQKIAYGPVVFQCVRYAWKRGMLQAIADAGEAGLSVEELAATGQWTPYVLKVVLETCLSAGVVLLSEGSYALDKAGFEMALFDENGAVNRLAVLEFNDLPVNKTKISRFDLAGADCAKISRVLINNSSSCAGAGVDPKLCLNALKTETRTKVTFGS